MNGYRNKSAFSAPIRRYLLVLATILNFAGMHNADADTWVPYLQEWVGSDGTHMGASIAVDGDASGAKFIYVGAPDETVNSLAEAGAVYVWAPSGQGVKYVATL